MKTNVFRIIAVGLNRLALLAGLVFAAMPNTGMAKQKWDPIAAQDLAATECKIYPGADAEIIIERQILSSSGDTQEQSFYRRTKIYSAKGANSAGVVAIEYPSRHKVWNLAAQVTKPDGSKQLFGKADFAESTVVKTASFKLKRLTLAVPGLGAGDVLDMVWSQSVDDIVNYYQWWFCQRTLPVREFIFEVASSKSDFSMMWFNVANAKIDSARAGGGRLIIKDIPPFEEEPHSLPERDIRGWFVLRYTHPYMRWYKNENGFWQELSSYLEEEFRLEIKPNEAIKTKSAELTKGAATDDEKLSKLYEFCQSHVTNFTYFDNAELQQAKKKLEGRDWRQSPAQTLSLGTGTPSKVNELFASLAKAAGYEVRLVLCASRYGTLNVRHRDGWLFMSDQLVAIKNSDGWRYFCPGDYYVPYGMLHSSNEGVPNLICDADKVIKETTSTSGAEKSPVQRKGRFVMDADGNLEGTVEISMGGHVGSGKKAAWADKQQDEIDADFREDIVKRMPAAEITELNWENIKGNALPLIVRFKLKVPAYADVAGNKLIVTPNVFEHGASAIFQSATRKFGIAFSNAYKENDDIEIAYPEGYALESGSSPQNVGDIAAAMGTHYQLGLKPKARLITYKREFGVGAVCTNGFRSNAYPVLKELCDSILRSDEHTLVLKAVQPVPASADAEPVVEKK